MDGKLALPFNQTLQTRDTADGLGDVLVYPFMLGWTNGSLKCDTRLGVYTSTGDFRQKQEQR